MISVFDELRAIDARLSNISAIAGLAALTSDEVKTYMRLAAAVKNSADRALACGAAEIHQRSRHELGSAGLAKAEGHVNPQTMIAELTGSSRTEARKLDRLGRSLMHTFPVPPQSDPEVSQTDPPVAQPWHADMCARMLAGEITPDRFEALRAGLGDPTERVGAAALRAAANHILGLLHADDLPETVYRDARAARSFVDRAGVAELENEQYARQQAKVWSDREGMVHLNAIFAPEDGTFVKSALDLLLGPRIGAPRLVGTRSRQEAQLLADDPRTIEQLTAGMLVALLKAGTDVRNSTIMAKKRPAVQIVVTAGELVRPNGDGIAFIEGTGIAVTTNTVSRMICDSGYQSVVLGGDGSPLDVGREHRLFQPAQRLALNVAQGRCVWPGCEKPPSFCEIHHIEHWATGGKTNVEDGVLLCKHHHLLLHSNGWSIDRHRTPQNRYEDRYWLTPPRSIDPAQKPRQLRFRGAAQLKVAARRPATA